MNNDLIDQIVRSTVENLKFDEVQAKRLSKGYMIFATMFSDDYSLVFIGTGWIASVGERHRFDIPVDTYMQELLDAYVMVPYENVLKDADDAPYDFIEGVMEFLDDNYPE